MTREEALKAAWDELAAAYAAALNAADTAYEAAMARINKEYPQ